MAIVDGKHSLAVCCACKCGKKERGRVEEGREEYSEKGGGDR